jgi:deoxycytidylate deaminase
VSSSHSRISGANPVFEDSELVFGLVAPVGTNFDRFTNFLERCLEKFGYATNLVRLSDLTKNFEVEPSSETGTPAFVRSNDLMHAGNYLRFSSRRGEFLALAAAQAIRATRTKGDVRLKTAHVLRSLKHPDEVRALRRIYGPGFYLIGITVSEADRRSFLRNDKGCTQDEVDRLFQRDEHEEDRRFICDDGQNYGQRTRDTYQLADAFVPLDAEVQLERFLSLIFGSPFLTPTPDEYAMFLAFGASLRSGDLSRQVGATVVSAEGDVVGVGANDVPRRGGGLYWPGDEDRRDYKRGEDSNEARRDVIVTDVLKRLRPDGVEEGEWLESGKRLLLGSLVMDITEYGRAVHAEMEAMLSCTRSGVSTRGGTLYSTTFPCHNCAKHIIGAGLRKVVYVEPYPKSQAKTLFGDSIVLGSEEPSEAKPRVEFVPFVGVGPRRFFDLFSIGLSSGTTMKRKKKGKPIEWTAPKGIVRIALLPNSYLDREHLAEQELLALTEPPPEKPSHEEDRS